MSVRCSVPNCGKNNLNSKRIIFYPFPLDSDLRQKWLEAVRAENLNPYSSRVCSRHFRKTDFFCKGRARHLKPDVVPSIFVCRDNASLKPHRISKHERKPNKQTDCTTRTRSSMPSVATSSRLPPEMNPIVLLTDAKRKSSSQVLHHVRHKVLEDDTRSNNYASDSSVGGGVLNSEQKQQVTETRNVHELPKQSSQMEIAIRKVSPCIPPVEQKTDYHSGSNKSNVSTQKDVSKKMLIDKQVQVELPVSSFENCDEISFVVEENYDHQLNCEYSFESSESNEVTGEGVCQISLNDSEEMDIKNVLSLPSSESEFSDIQGTKRKREENVPFFPIISETFSCASFEPSRDNSLKTNCSASAGISSVCISAEDTETSMNSVKKKKEDLPSSDLNFEAHDVTSPLKGTNTDCHMDNDTQMLELSTSNNSESIGKETCSTCLCASTNCSNNFSRSCSSINKENMPDILSLGDQTHRIISVENIIQILKDFIRIFESKRSCSNVDKETSCNSTNCMFHSSPVNGIIENGRRPLYLSDIIELSYLLHQYNSHVKDASPVSHPHDSSKAVEEDSVLSSLLNICSVTGLSTRDNEKVTSTPPILHPELQTSVHGDIRPSETECLHGSKAAINVRNASLFSNLNSESYQITLPPVEQNHSITSLEQSESSYSQKITDKGKDGNDSSHETFPDSSGLTHHLEDESNSFGTARQNTSSSELERMSSTGAQELCLAKSNVGHLNQMSVSESSDNRKAYQRGECIEKQVTNSHELIGNTNETCHKKLTEVTEATHSAVIPRLCSLQNFVPPSLETNNAYHSLEVSALDKFNNMSDNERVPKNGVKIKEEVVPCENDHGQEVEFERSIGYSDDDDVEDLETRVKSLKKKVKQKNKQLKELEMELAIRTMVDRYTPKLFTVCRDAVSKNYAAKILLTAIDTYEAKPYSHNLKTATDE